MWDAVGQCRYHQMNGDVITMWYANCAQNIAVVGALTVVWKPAVVSCAELFQESCSLMKDGARKSAGGLLLRRRTVMTISLLLVAGTSSTAS